MCAVDGKQPDKNLLSELTGSELLESDNMACSKVNNIYFH